MRGQIFQNAPRGFKVELTGNATVKTRDGKGEKRIARMRGIDDFSSQNL